MTFEHHFDNKIRFLVLYQDVSKKPTVIQKYTGISLRTIQRWIQKTEENVNILERQAGQGRKPIIPDNVKENIVRTARRKPNKSSTRKLAHQYNIGKSSVNRVLSEKDYEYKKVKVSKKLTSDEKSNRVKFCRYMLKENGKRINNSFFSDEMGYSLSEAHKEKAWTSSRKRVKVDSPINNVRLNCWGAISAQGATSLHIYKTTLKSDTYCNILQEHKEEMDEILPPGYNFQHDNLKAHVPGGDWMKRQGVKMLNFPTYSPDLSPIENLWGTLKGAVAADNPTTEAQLRKSLLKNWETLTNVDKLQPYFTNLYNRYDECIEKGGEKLNY
jgi:transposase